ncbi:MAG: ABC transporter permease subunit [bacterium]|nr:ABC transporter permease subunit [bacterium]MCP5066641.1 ABC transporter permease subunit [bacterium]
MALGIAISLPLAILALRVRPIAGPLLAVASIIQTIPGLALLALMVPLLGRIGLLPALMALVLYSLLPVLRNTVTGASEVDPNVLEAARGIGMTDNQVLWRVQIPLAMPVIVAGVRTASVWTVGMATLSTPVGATSLGNYIFSGLQTQNMAAVMLGCVASASLAIGLDLLIRIAEVASVRRDPRLAAIPLVGLALAVGLASWPQLSDALRESPRPRAVVGAKTFTEQYILAQLITSRLEAAGFEVDTLDSLGSTVVFDALTTGEIDIYVDYSGTIWANHMKRGDTPPASEVLAEMAAWLDREHRVLSLGPLGFENAYALAMRRDRADALGISTIEDLARRSPQLSAGGDYEFFARPEWIAVRDRYGLDFKQQRSLDSTLMYSAVVEEEVDVISAFSSDGRIAAYDLRVLSDPLQAFPPYDAVVLLSQSARFRPELVAALTPLIGAIDDDLMRSANKLVDVDSKTIVEAAASLDAATRP